jgi:hypothetical protein
MGETMLFDLRDVLNYLTETKNQRNMYMPRTPDQPDSEDELMIYQEENSEPIDFEDMSEHSSRPASVASPLPSEDSSLARQEDDIPSPEREVSQDDSGLSFRNSSPSAYIRHGTAYPTRRRGVGTSTSILGLHGQEPFNRLNSLPVPFSTAGLPPTARPPWRPNFSPLQESRQSEDSQYTDDDVRMDDAVVGGATADDELHIDPSHQELTGHTPIRPQQRQAVGDDASPEANISDQTFPRPNDQQGNPQNLVRQRYPQQPTKRTKYARDDVNDVEAEPQPKRRRANAEAENNIESRLDHVGYEYISREEERLNEDEEMELMPFDITISKLNSKRHRIRDKWPEEYAHHDAAMVEDIKTADMERPIALLRLRKKSVGGS